MRKCIYSINISNNPQLSLEWISNFKVSPNESERKVLTQQIRDKFVGIGQRVIEAKPFGNHAAVLWDVLFVFSVTTGSITRGF